MRGYAGSLLRSPLITNGPRKLAGSWDLATTLILDFPLPIIGLADRRSVTGSIRN